VRPPLLRRRADGPVSVFFLPAQVQPTKQMSDGGLGAASVPQPVAQSAGQGLACVPVSNWYPYRYAFTVSFFVILTAYRVFDTLHLTARSYVAVLAVFSVLDLFGNSLMILRGLDEQFGYDSNSEYRTYKQEVSGLLRKRMRTTAFSASARRRREAKMRPSASATTASRISARPTTRA
jgi:hypothetical protein